MKRKKLEPLPLPPEGWMFNQYGSLISIKRLEISCQIYVDDNYPGEPRWYEDDTYNMRSSKYGKVKHK